MFSYQTIMAACIVTTGKTTPGLRKNLTTSENRCFYDFTITENGVIILCGGTKEIAKGIKKIPRGFIALTDTSLQSIERLGAVSGNLFFR